MGANESAPLNPTGLKPRSACVAPTGLGESLLLGIPTLNHPGKRWANNHCAYGAFGSTKVVP